MQCCDKVSSDGILVKDSELGDSDTLWNFRDQDDWFAFGPSGNFLGRYGSEEEAKLALTASGFEMSPAVEVPADEIGEPNVFRYELWRVS